MGKHTLSYLLRSSRYGSMYSGCKADTAVIYNIYNSWYTDYLTKTSLPSRRCRVATSVMITLSPLLQHRLSLCVTWLFTGLQQ